MNISQNRCKKANPDLPKKCPTGTFLLEKCPSKIFPPPGEYYSFLLCTYLTQDRFLSMMGNTGVEEKRTRGDYNFPPSSRQHLPHIYSSLPTWHTMGDSLHHIDAPTLSTRCAPKAHQERERERDRHAFLQQKGRILQSRVMVVAWRVLAASLLSRSLPGTEAGSELTATTVRNCNPTLAERCKLDAGGMMRDKDSGCDTVVIRPVTDTYVSSCKCLYTVVTLSIRSCICLVSHPHTNTW